ncbi:VWA domain-containing protein [Pedosphaera parvula]|uniref:von Willebrand factor type A n=1 Tax=Pedosphaera parvula (strain Ellin514) TaxID=320771 RepID=B9XSA8_PEDPL|nr:VWA domain-containing protein [Pedosphaera parvula]EEF57278.1 von Willebrand factor type A [Pedosphaera parvula Ellin514]
MNFQFTHPYYLMLLIPALVWVVWLALKSDVQVSAWRRWTGFWLRTVIVTALILALAGLQWLRPLEGMNVFFLLDRSDSVPSPQQEAARTLVNQMSEKKKKTDKAGVVVFGSEASIETAVNQAVDVEKIQAVVGRERTDIEGAIRLGTAAFPENGQKRLVLLSDGNENVGDAMASVLASRPLGVTVDVVPMGITRGNDVSVQKLSVPPKLKKGQVFELKIFVQADRAQSATIRLYRNEQYLGEQKVELSAGKNLFTFPQTLPEPGFYSYDVRVEAPGDLLPQNNRASAFTSVKGEPRILIVSSDPDADKELARALQSSRLETKLVGINGMPSTLGEMQSYDSIFLSNVAAGDLGRDLQLLLESAVRDFGVGLVCVGGDQTYAAGGYRGTPLETTLPLDMELDSKKVLPSGAVALVMHGMEFANGNQVARDCAQGVLAALGPNDEMGVVLWDGNEHWLFPMTKVKDKKALGRQIAGMNQGDLPSFQGVMTLAHEGLKKSHSNLKHIIVFSDGDPNAPSPSLMNDIVSDRITVSTVLIAGHAGPETMIWIADHGKGRFYPVTSPNELPQIFIKEAAVILKSAIYEDPFKPQLRASSELVRGIGATEYPMLLGYVATTPKPRAEVPLWTDKGDPLLAHWQYGLGRAVAFTSDAKAKWAKNWLGWDKYKQFWSQIGQWSLRRLENADFTTDVTVEKGEGQISLEALDEQGNYKNFLELVADVVSPKGEKISVPLEQTGPGHYEAKFPTKAVGSYVLNIKDIKDGKVRGSQVVGASVNYSPEFNASEPNENLLRRLAESGGGKVLDPDNLSDNPFLHDRQKTFQPRELWEWLLKFAILMFPLDVAVRRIQLEREEMQRAWRKVRSKIFFWQGVPREPEAEESLTALLARRDQVRSTQTAASEPNPDLFRPEKPVVLATKDIFAPAGEQESETAVADHPGVATKSKEPDKNQPVSTTSRLLDAKRRAQKRKE